ncbi:hypothetical protein JOM56_008267 [Amanita muscaria]
MQSELHSVALHRNNDSSVQDPDTRRCLELMTKVLIGHAASLIKQPHCHEIDHFAPEFSILNNNNPQVIELNFKDWEQILHPLLNVLNKLLGPSNIYSLKTGYCQRCRFIQITHDTLTRLKSLGERENPDVDKCLKSLEEIIKYGERRLQKFDMNFGRVVFGSAAMFGFLMATLAHFGHTGSSETVAYEVLTFISVFFI